MRREQLRLGDGLALPLDAVTRTTGIVGQRGTGKTSTAVVMVEEAAAAGAPFAVVDPTGAWYGLRASADGQGAGLDVVVLGGHNGDLPLEPAAGGYVARLVAEQTANVVLDLERMTKGEQVRFVAEFAETLYHLNRSALLVVIDEAHRFAPQQLRDPGGYGARCLGAVSDVVTLGRRKGLGAVLISQRPAKINKDVLEQAEVMVAHRLMGPNDRKALAGWMEEAHVGDGPQLASLSQLGRGDAVVWAPAFDIYGSWTIREKHTFDSSATPEVGQAVVAPQGRPALDLGAVRDAMAEMVERAEQDDPAALRRRIADLERRLAEAPADDDLVPRADAIANEHALNAQIDALLDERERLAGRVIDLQGLVRPLYEQAGHVAGAVGELRAEAQERTRKVYGVPVATDERMPADRWAVVSAPDFAEGADAAGGAASDAKGVQTIAAPDDPAAGDGSRDHRPNGDRRAPSSSPVGGGNAVDPGGAHAQPGSHTLVAGSRRMLEALARYGPLTRTELSTLGNTFGGAMRNNLSKLRTAGLVEEQDGRVELTAAGAAEAGEPGGPWYPSEVVAMHEGKLVAGARRILDVVMRSPERGFTRKELEGLAGSRGGAFRNNLSALRRRGLVEERSRRVYPGHVLYADQVAARRGEAR